MFWTATPNQYPASSANSPITMVTPWLSEWGHPTNVVHPAQVVVYAYAPTRSDVYIVRWDPEAGHYRRDVADIVPMNDDEQLRLCDECPIDWPDYAFQPHGEDRHTIDDAEPELTGWGCCEKVMDDLAAGTDSNLYARYYLPNDDAWLCTPHLAGTGGAFWYAERESRLYQIWLMHLAGDTKGAALHFDVWHYGLEAARHSDIARRYTKRVADAYVSLAFHTAKLEDPEAGDD